VTLPASHDTAEAINNLSPGQIRRVVQAAKKGIKRGNRFEPTHGVDALLGEIKKQAAVYTSQGLLARIRQDKEAQRKEPVVTTFAEKTAEYVKEAVSVGAFLMSAAAYPLAAAGAVGGGAIAYGAEKNKKDRPKATARGAVRGGLLGAVGGAAAVAAHLPKLRDDQRIDALRQQPSYDPKQLRALLDRRRFTAPLARAGRIGLGVGTLGSMVYVARKAAQESAAAEKMAEVEYRGRTFPGYNTPVASNRPEKKKMVLAKKGDQVRLIHFGQKGYKHNYSEAAKKNYLARSAGIKGKSGLTKDDKFSANYWARKELWPAGEPADGTARNKEANLRAYAGDFTAGMDPLGTFVTDRAANAERQGASASTQRKRLAATTAGGIAGGAVVIPSAITGLTAAAKGFLRGSGGAQGRLAAAGRHAISVGDHVAQFFVCFKNCGGTNQMVFTDL
jgi:hypothetical protein